MPANAPEKHGFNAARLNRIDAFLKDKYLDSGLLPNAQLLISRGGEIVHFSHQGAANEGSQKSVNEETIYRIASMTKPITSVGFMMLVEEGKVAVDTPVADVLPEFKDAGVYVSGGDGAPFVTAPATAPMRMLDLLRHTSGLTYGFQNRTHIDAGYRAGKVDIDRVDNWFAGKDMNWFVGELAKYPLEFNPGEAWNYSLATDVLGAVIERVSGMPLDVYLSEKIFAPLGMKDTAFMVPEGKTDRLADCYFWRGAEKGRVMYDRASESRWRQKPDVFSGGGGLVSTALDYHRFCLMCANGGELDGARILGRKTLDLMTMNHLPGNADLTDLSRSLFSEAQNAGTGFGLGFAVTVDVAKTMVPGSVGEYHWGGMFSTSFFIDPVEELHMVFMTQLSPSWIHSIRRELKTMIYAAMN